MTDPVSKLQAVGKETVSKLRDMQAAAAASLNAEDEEVLEEFTCQTRCIVTGAPFAHACPLNLLLHLTHNFMSYGSNAMANAFDDRAYKAYTV